MGRRWQGPKAHKNGIGTPPRMDESPFDRPEVMSGYPLSDREKEAIDSVVNEYNDRITTKDDLQNPDEYRFHLGQAVTHAQTALDMHYGRGHIRRGWIHRLRLQKAHSILMSMYVKEHGRRKDGR